MRDDIAIRSFAGPDAQALIDMILPVFRAGETYAVDPGISAEAALAYWCAPGKQVFMAGTRGQPLGTYYIRPNHGGGGSHVCNCGYVTAPAARGKGVARAMLDHSLTQARRRGYLAMQFNFVVANNARAIDIWTRAGFRTVGRLPGAFRHPADGCVDALVMWKDLTDAA